MMLLHSFSKSSIVHKYICITSVDCLPLYFQSVGADSLYELMDTYAGTSENVSLDQLTDRLTQYTDTLH